MSKINQIKIPVEIKPMYTLVREEDGLTHHGRQVGWVEWDDDGVFKAQHDEPAVGMSCMLDPHRMNFTWLTTKVTEIVEQKDDYIKFKTLNSTYKLKTGRKLQKMGAD